MPAYFVTGTDTEIGKTTIAAGLLHRARLQGLATAGIKPVASGCERTAEGLRNGDALALLGETSLPLGYSDINPIALEPAIAPHLAAREAGIDLSVAALAAPVTTVVPSAASCSGCGGSPVCRSRRCCPEPEGACGLGPDL